mgnify:FL=1
MIMEIKDLVLEGYENDAIVNELCGPDATQEEAELIANEIERIKAALEVAEKQEKAEKDTTKVEVDKTEEY